VLSVVAIQVRLYLHSLSEHDHHITSHVASHHHIQGISTTSLTLSHTWQVCGISVGDDLWQSTGCYTYTSC